MTDPRPESSGGQAEQPAKPSLVTLTCSICGKTGLKSIGFTNEYTHNYLDCAKEVAAERDRLRQTVIDAEKRCIELLQERDRLLAVVEMADNLFSGTNTPLGNLAHAVLAEARQPED